MTFNRSAAGEPDDPDDPDPPEAPSAAAQLQIWTEPAEGRPPPSAGMPPEARYLIAALAIMGTVAATTVGAVVLCRSAPGLAFAVVLLGLMAAILIAIGGHGHEL